MNLRAALEHLLEIIACKPLLHRKDLMRRYGVDDSTIDRWTSRGVLPRPTYLRGSSIPLWKPFEIAVAESTNRTLLRTLSKLNDSPKRK